MIKKFIIAIISLVFLTNTNFAFAQLGTGDITLSISPSIPKSGDTIKAVVKSYSVDLNKAYIIWKLNDETRISGIGKTSFSFILGAISSQNDLNVSIETVDGKTINKSLSITSNDVDLLWEATDSYVPPFYKGKALFGREGEIKVSAIPSIYSGQNKVSPNTLSYTWEKDGNGDIKASGFGKNYFTYKNSFLDKNNTIRATISTINNTTNAKGEITIFPTEPKVVVYKKNYFGDYIKALDLDNNIPKEGALLVAVPYFFSPYDIRDNNLKIDWFVNGEQILNPISKNELFIEPATGKTGTATIQLVVENIKTLFQSTQRKVLINF